MRPRISTPEIIQFKPSNRYNKVRFSSVEEFNLKQNRKKTHRKLNGEVFC